MASPEYRVPDGVPPFYGDFSRDDLPGQLDLLLFGGGGLAHPDARTGYAGLDSGAPDLEIWFSSTTATRPGRRARAAAQTALSRLAGVEAPFMPLSGWFNSLRGRIAGIFDASDDCVLLAPSPTEGLALARYIATILTGEEPLEIIAPPEETGVFSTFSSGAVQHVVELRDETGAPLDQTDIDAQAHDIARRALRDGRALLAHALDMSRTGLSGVSREAARAIVDAAPGRAMAVIDASDFRVSPGRLAADLAEGGMVLVSGSRFMGGPPHCCALLLPPAVVAALDGAKARFDPDIAPARFDIPARLRHLFGGGFDTAVNVGLGLRWSGALAEIGRYLAIPAGTRDSILDIFSMRARAFAARRDFLELEPGVNDLDEPLRGSVLALYPVDPRGGRIGAMGANAIRAGLALPRPAIQGDAICHIGAAVPTISGAALTIAASAPMVSGIAERMAGGVSFDRAIAPVWRDLETLLGKWEALVA